MPAPPPHVSVLVAALALVPLLTACVDTPHTNSAERFVQQEAELLGRRMEAQRGSLSQRAAQVLPAATSREQVVVMKVEEDEIVLRITRATEASGFDSAHTATRCYRYTFRGSVDDGTPDRVRCPDTPPVEVRRDPPGPTLPVDAQQQVQRVLRGLPAQHDEAQVRAALTPVMGTAVVYVRVEGGAVGVAVRGEPDGSPGRGPSCLVGRRSSGEPPVVWYMPRVLAQPGELGCSADYALRPVEAPH